jgi:hypothetical protein
MTMSVSALGVVARRIAFVLVTAVSPAVIASHAAPPAAVEAKQQQALVMFRCWHDNLSMWHCGDSIANTSGALANEIASASLSVRTRDNRSIVMDLPRNTDGVFLTEASIRMFLLRYYTDTHQDKKRTDLEAFLGTPLMTKSAKGAKSAKSANSAQASAVMMRRCVHDNLSMWTCADSTKNASGVNVADIASIGLTIRTKAGKTITSELPSNTDAVFLTKPSIQMFLVRYYTDTQQERKRTDLLAHLKG